MRCSLTLIVAAGALCFPLPAHAQQKSNCPPGSWFCAEAEVQVMPSVQPPPAPPQAAPPPPPAVAPPPSWQPPPGWRPPPPPGAPPPVVIYQPVPLAPPPHVVIVTPGYGYGYGYGYRPAPPRVTYPRPQPRLESEWGLNLRVEGAAIGRPANAYYSPGLAGVGMSLRYRPVPAFAFDLGADILTGVDYNGFSRTEVPLSLSGLLYLNPRSRVQLYLEGGAQYSRAEVRSDQASSLLVPVTGGQYGATYTYLGGHGGLGLEFRLSRRVALNVDGLGFVRKRVGDITTPEFVEAGTNRATNTSGGALFRAGLTFWW